MLALRINEGHNSVKTGSQCHKNCLCIYEAFEQGCVVTLKGKKRTFLDKDSFSLPWHLAGTYESHQPLNKHKKDVQSSKLTDSFAASWYII